MMEVQCSSFSCGDSLRAQIKNARLAAHKHIVEDEQKVNSQVRTSEGSFMSVSA